MKETQEKKDERLGINATIQARSMQSSKNKNNPYTGCSHVHEANIYSVVSQRERLQPQQPSDSPPYSLAHAEEDAQDHDDEPDVPHEPDEQPLDREPQGAAQPA
ncbi:hypothetical protein ACCO45_006894 [Purpureocillium lilacinum]|uniref:Uncharacterized protein n=1 Tax=Purpureocillium lilacinum TaxID=33203 RepID=A0ACC4DQS3_PURLI